MSAPLLQTLRRLIIRVIRSLYLSKVEIGILQEDSQTILLLENHVSVPYAMCLFSEHLVEHTVEVEQETMEGTNQMTFRVQRSLKDQDRVAVARLLGGEQYIVLDKVISDDGL